VLINYDENMRAVKEDVLQRQLLFEQQERDFKQLLAKQEIERQLWMQQPVQTPTGDLQYKPFYTN